MASAATVDRDRTDASRTPRIVSHDETKPSFKTTELFTMLGIVVAILIAAASADNFDAPRAWTLVAVVASAYIVSRGFAKAGSPHVENDR
jgi:hypothetical protein